MKTVKFDGKLMSVVSKPYDFEGNKGVSYTALVFVLSEVFKVKISSSLYETLKDVSDASGVLEFTISSFNMKPVLTLVSFVRGK